MRRLLNKTRLQHWLFAGALSGWLFAGVLIVSLVAMGAHSNTEKYGMVDLDRAIQESEYGKKAFDGIRQARQKRIELLEFVSTYRVVGPDHAKRLKTLMLKSDLNNEEKAELEKIRNGIIEDSKNQVALSQKKDTTDAEKKLLQDYAQKAKGSDQLLQDWQGSFSEELRQQGQEFELNGRKKINEALEKTAKSKGYSGIFNVQAMPYCANNLTEDVIKTLDADTKKEAGRSAKK